MTVSYDKPNLRRVFTQGCLDKFHYLAAYGYELTSTEDDRYVTEVTYKSQITGIKVSFEFRENQIFVYLIQLINGEIPAYLDAPSNWFYLDNLVKLRSPSTTLPRKEFGDWLTPDDIDEILTAYASALKEYGEDVLHGDFFVFAELAQQIDRPKSSSSIDEVRLIIDETRERAAAPSETAKRPPTPPTNPLTTRETEVLSLVAQGLTNRMIGQLLVLSPGTVKRHMEHIIAKLGVSDRTQAAAKAYDLNLIAPPIR